MRPASDELRVRVTVADAWQVVPLALPPEATVAELKRRALEGVGMGGRRPEEFAVKVMGGLVGDERQTLDAAGVSDGSGVVVLPRRRRAVR